MIETSDENRSKYIKDTPEYHCRQNSMTTNALTTIDNDKKKLTYDRDQILQIVPFSNRKNDTIPIM
jgi:hypothetical protein